MKNATPHLPLVKSIQLNSSDLNNNAHNNISSQEKVLHTGGASTTCHFVTWNVNSVNTRLPLITDFINEEKPDVLLLQEIKCMDEKFCYSSFEDLGYNIAVYGQKSYNGVAILSKFRIDEINKLDFAGGEGEARYIECLLNCNSHSVRCASVYVPNGRLVGSPHFEKKLEFYKDMQSHLKTLLTYDEIMLIGGDFNVAPEELDVYDAEYFENSVGFHIEERQRIRAIINEGYIDTWRLRNPAKMQFSWWDYRDVRSVSQNRGMRIDYILTSPMATDKVQRCHIFAEFRSKTRPSDHVPVSCYIAL